jgi:hypothetical protein
MFIPESLLVNLNLEIPYSDPLLYQVIPRLLTLFGLFAPGLLFAVMEYDWGVTGVCSPMGWCLRCSCRLLDDCRIGGRGYVEIGRLGLGGK